MLVDVWLRLKEEVLVFEAGEGEAKVVVRVVIWFERDVRVGNTEVTSVVVGIEARPSADSKDERRSANAAIAVVVDAGGACAGG